MEEKVCVDWELPARVWYCFLGQVVVVFVVCVLLHRLKSDFGIRNLGRGE